MATPATASLDRFGECGRSVEVETLLELLRFPLLKEKHFPNASLISCPKVYVDPDVSSFKHTIVLLNTDSFFFFVFGFDPSKGVLVCGESGVGKMSLVDEVCREVHQVYSDCKYA